MGDIEDQNEKLKNQLQALNKANETEISRVREQATKEANESSLKMKEQLDSALAQIEKL